ncbi:MAG: threonine/serine exporter family protein [Clostridiales bacterium]|nr:threonine/serine exporter family protein [Clostridiales bacterium]
MEKQIIKKTLEVAILAGRIMLENGAETSRVEDTIQRICCSRGLVVENFTIPTGIFLSCQYNDDYYPYVIRTKSMTIDLEIIAKINSFSRKFVDSDMCADDAFLELQEIKQTPHFKPWIVSTFGGVAGGFFTLAFKGSFLEAIIAFITSLVVVTVVNRLSKHAGAFVRNAIGGMVNTLVAFILIGLFSSIDPNLSLSNIVIGSLMPLVPGVAITNAFRDSISGDFVSGVSKLTEAVLVAVAIALGVGVILHLKVLMTGSV